MASAPLPPDYYEVLGISQYADLTTVKESYKRLARVTHPDRRRNDASATAKFQLLLEAYEHLYDIEKRQKYDDIYQSTILPWKAKNRKIEALNRELLILRNRRKGPENSLFNAKKDLNRLYAEIDSLKSEKERIVRERARDETWWPYLCSFVPGNAATFTKQRNRQQKATVDLIGRQMTKQGYIDRKRADIRTIEEDIMSISSREKVIEEQKQAIESNWARDIWLKERGGFGMF
ncbi:DnaJ domain protein [Penicillium angulare]|uniref:DnaJ domain protein n=1 Tax=Penicillium angulare TaxID=116970 RepID=A0A9W9K553_9EURO|nr:DnaJ domain protein [Penicillium angulare]